MDKKKFPFALLAILQEESDEDHILSSSDLIERMKERFDMEAERRSIYANIRLLKEEGFAISSFEENNRGYYMKGRSLSAAPFAKSEILLLCNAIHASHFIDEKESETLINKLLTMLSTYQKEEFREQVYLPNAAKTDNTSLMRNIDLISEACHTRHQIAFCYLHYNAKKELIRNDQRYILSPHYIVFHDERPYVIATGRHPGISHYRIDRITNLVIRDEKCEPLAEADKQEAYAYARDRLFMFAGEPVYVRYICENRIMNAMIDLFGRDVRTTSLEGDPDHFAMVIRTTPAGAVFLAQQYMDAIELVEPADIRQQVIASLSAALKRYQD
jgi:predicted DNA-binding transcriptional regulator YafY